MPVASIAKAKQIGTFKVRSYGRGQKLATLLLYRCAVDNSPTWEIELTSGTREQMQMMADVLNDAIEELQESIDNS